MNEIYWISRLDNLLNCFAAVLVLAVAALVGLFFYLLIEDKTWDDIKRWVKMSAFAGCVSILALVFVPSTDAALLIWGVGGTIDYIQDSDKLRELPDKCVEALDLWIESITENE